MRENDIKKEHIKAELMLRQAFNSKYQYDNRDFQKLFDSTYPNINKVFNEKDGYLKRRIDSILNEPRN